MIMHVQLIMDLAFMMSDKVCGLLTVKCVVVLTVGCSLCSAAEQVKEAYWGLFEGFALGSSVDDCKILKVVLLSEHVSLSLLLKIN